MKDTKKIPAAICMVKESIESRKMIFNLAKNDFKTKYAGSYLGIIWAFVQPVVTILLYWFVFQVGFRSRPLITGNKNIFSFFCKYVFYDIYGNSICN